MYALDIPLARQVLGERADQAPPAPAEHLDSYFYVIVEVDDAAAFLLGKTPMHVEPFYQRGPGEDVLSEFLFVTVRFGALASSLMVEVDTDAMSKAPTWLQALTVLTDQLTEAAGTVVAHLLPGKPDS